MTIQTTITEPEMLELEKKGKAKITKLGTFNKDYIAFFDDYVYRLDKGIYHRLKSVEIHNTKRRY